MLKKTPKFQSIYEDCQMFIYRHNLGSNTENNFNKLMLLNKHDVSAFT